MFLDQIRQSAEVTPWSQWYTSYVSVSVSFIVFLMPCLFVYCSKTFCSSILSLSLCLFVFDLPPYFCSVLHLSSRVWSRPTVEKLTVKKREARGMRGKGEWRTGLNWPVYCVGGSSPAKRPSSGTSSSLSYIRWWHKQYKYKICLLQTLNKWVIWNCCHIHAYILIHTYCTYYYL